MKLTVTVKSKNPMLSEETLTSLLLDMLVRGEPMPKDIAKSLRTKGKASYTTDWAEATYELS